MGDQIEMSTAENIFGSVSKFLTPQTSPRPTFLFNNNNNNNRLFLFCYIKVV